MKVISNISIVLIGTIVCYSCHHLSESVSADSSNATKIVYDYTNIDEIDLDQIIDSCSYVKLETSDDILIGRIDKLMLCDSFIVVVDQRIAKSIYVFDNNGHYLNRISRLGNGPDEYLIINGVTMNSRHEVCIMDNIKQRISVFDITGRKLYCQNTPFRSCNVEYVGDDNLLFDVEGASVDRGHSDVQNACYVVTDTKANTIYTFGSDQSAEVQDYIHIQDIIRRCGDTLYGRLCLGNTFYSFLPQSVEANFELSLLGGELYVPSAQDRASIDTYLSRRDNQPSLTGDFFICRDFSCFEFSFPEDEYAYHWLYYDNTTKKQIRISHQSQDPLIYYFNTPMTSWNDNTLVQVIPAVTLISDKNRIIQSANINDKDYLYDDLTVDSNPVLFFYTINIRDNVPY